MSTKNEEQTNPKNQHYVVVDLETTGMSRDRHSITEIAAVRYDGQKIIGEFEMLVNPGRPIPPQISRLTGITNEMVIDKPYVEDVLPKFFEFLGDDVMVAHNAPFDEGFIRTKSRKYLAHNPLNPVICTRKLSYRLVQEIKSKSLHSLCEYFSITNNQAHRAMSDVLATTKLLEYLLESADFLGLQSVDDLLEFQSRPMTKVNKYIAKQGIV